MGLPIDYYPLVMKALDLISQGRTVSAATDAAGIPYSTFRSYVDKTPELQQIFNECEQRGYDRMADTLVEIDVTCAIAGVTDPKVMKVLSDNIRWFLSRKRPQQYGERVTVTHNITADKAITDALMRGRERAMGTLIEDATYTVVEQVVLPDAAVPIQELDDELLQFV